MIKKLNIQKLIVILLSVVTLLTVHEVMQQLEIANLQPFTIVAQAKDKEKDKDKKKDKDDKDEKEAKNEDEEEAEKVDKDNEDPFLYTTDTGQLQVQTTGADLQADIYLVIEDKDENEWTIYVSPYRDSKNEQRVPAGEYSINEIYLLDEDYEDTYEFEHNDKLIVFPDEKVFFDINVIEVNESKPNELLKKDNEEPDNEEEQTIEVESESQKAEETTKASIFDNKLYVGLAVAVVVIGSITYGLLKYYGFLDKA